MKRLLILSLVLWSSSTYGQSSYEMEDIPEALEANADIEAQVQGDYPPLSRKESLPLGAIQHAWDKGEDTSGVYTVNFNPREIIRLRLREYMTTTISLPFWERIDSYVVGDDGAYFVKTVNGNTLNVRSHGMVGVDTSLTVYGKSGQVYGFYLRTEGYNSKNTSDIIVHVQAPKALVKNERELYQATSQKDIDFLEQVTTDPGQFNFSYSMAGDREIAPDRVYTDGKKTWFDYGSRIKTQDLPVIFNVVDGIDTPINVIREGTKLVAHGSGKFSLKHGNKLVCVYPSKA